MPLAPVGWASVRVFYRVEYAAAHLAWLCSRAPHVLALLYWRAYRWGGLAAGAARWCYWRIAYPFLKLGYVIHGGLLTILRVSDRKRSAGEDVVRQSDSVPKELVELVSALDAEDVLVLPSAERSQLEMLLQLLPSLGLSSPLPTTLHVRFASGGREVAGLADEGGGMLTARLRSGSPIRTIVLHADSAKQCHALERRLNLRVYKCGDHRGPAALRRRFAAASMAVPTAAREALDVPPSLVVDRFGPVALLISALWGRTGSTAIFDAQTRHLVARGFIVARILVDHYPQTGTGRAARMDKLLALNFEKACPHFHFVAERRDGLRHLWRLHATRAFRESSPIGRMSMLLADASIDRSGAAAWCADRAVVTVVNHLPHVAFAERLASAPIVLETHDIFAKLLTTHGIPGFVPKGPDDDKRREADEVDVWRRVAACVNLSPDDHAVVASAAKRSVLARPYVDRIQRARRSWREILSANQLPANLHEVTSFDIMLWGDWHAGNVAGVRWFLEQVIDKHASLRQASILLAGRVVQALPPRLLRRQRLYAVGFVDSIDDFFSHSTVLVIPDQPESTGTSIKAMDALARRCCFASTAAGLRGVALGDTGLTPSNDAAALARDIAGLLQSRDVRRGRAAAARRLYELNFSKAAYSQAWDGLLHALLPDLPALATGCSQDLTSGVVAPPSFRPLPEHCASVSLPPNSTRLPAAS